MSEQTTSMINTDQIFTRTQIITILFCAFVAFSLGSFGFHQYYAQAKLDVSLLDVLYDSASLFFFQFNGQPGSVPLSLEIARWLAPISLSYAAIKTLLAILGGKVDRIRVRWLTGHAIVFGLNERSKSTVQSLLHDGTPVVCVDENTSLREWLKKRGGYFLPSFAEDKELLISCNSQEARYLLAATSDDQANIRIIHTACQERLENPQAPMLLTAVEIRNHALASAVYSLPSVAEDHDSFSARVIHYAAMNARLLLNNHGPHREISNLRGRNRQLNIMLIGQNDFWDVLAIRMATIGYYGCPHPHHVCLVESNANRRLENIQKDNSAINDLLQFRAQEIDLTLLNINNGKKLLGEFSPDIIYLCADRLDSALIWTQTLNRLEVEVPVICISTDSTTRSILEPQLKDHNNFKFCCLDDLCAHHDNIFNIKHDKLAKAIHDNYVANELAKGTTPEDNPSLVPWKQLPENLKDSNRNQADHVDIKCCLLTGKNDYSAKEVKGKLNPDTIEWLAQIEHDRWCAEKFLSGWRYAEGEKNSDLQLNPNLVHWNSLKEDERAKDRDAVVHLPELVEMKRTLESES